MFAQPRHSGLLLNRQTAEATRLSIDRRADKRSAARPCDGTLSCSKRKGVPADATAVGLHVLTEWPQPQTRREGWEDGRREAVVSRAQSLSFTRQKEVDGGDGS